MFPPNFCPSHNNKGYSTHFPMEKYFSIFVAERLHFPTGTHADFSRK